MLVIAIFCTKKYILVNIDLNLRRLSLTIVVYRLMVICCYKFYVNNLSISFRGPYCFIAPGPPKGGEGRKSLHYILKCQTLVIMEGGSISLHFIVKLEFFSFFCLVKLELLPRIRDHIICNRLDQN